MDKVTGGNPDFLCRFVLFELDAMANESDSVQDSGNMTAVQLKEFEKNFKAVIGAHREAVQSSRKFWRAPPTPPGALPSL